MTESVIRRYTLTEPTAWVDMPMPERYGCIDIDERRVISDIEIKNSRWDRYLGMTAAMTQVPVPTAIFPISR